MVRNMRKLEEYVTILPFLGCVTLLGGIFATFIVFSTKNPEDWVQNYFYFNALGAFLGYFYMSQWNPGGRVTLNFDKSTYSEDEKILDKLIIKYRNNILMVVPTILYVSADFILIKAHSQAYVGSVEGDLVGIIIGAFITLTTTMGIKYLSAWWNIKRNWKKEFNNIT